MVNSGRYVFRNTKILFFFEFCISVWVTYRPTDGPTNGQTGKLTVGPVDEPMDGLTDGWKMD